ncbi:MAG: flagellar basal body rod protein FlgC [Rhodospirillales bacterium]|nr:flagellar basal body rod protein FlgC [Rhodospirillales bacterium]
MDDIIKTMRISSAGMQVQGARLRVISENIANADSLPQDANGKPYRRKVITFQNELNRATGLDMVRVRDIRPDHSDFGKKFDPNHPAADEDGYVLTPNVNSLVEMSDMREAQRSYEANLQMIKASKAMLNGAIEVLR